MEEAKRASWWRHGDNVDNEGAVDDELRGGAGDEVAGMGVLESARRQLLGVRNLSEEDPLLQCPSSTTTFTRGERTML
jgi:hypothetical protein